MPQITIVDSTLRDGAQGELLSFSVQDKLNIALALDDFGIDCIEAGTPASNPKDMEFFRKLASVPLKNARPCAFGTTRRKEHTVAEDEGLGLLLEANTPIVSIVGKASLRQVTEVIKATQEENTAMIADSSQEPMQILNAELSRNGMTDDKAYTGCAVRFNSTDPDTPERIVGVTYKDDTDRPFVKVYTLTRDGAQWKTELAQTKYFDGRSIIMDNSSLIADAMNVPRAVTVDGKQCLYFAFLNHLKGAGEGNNGRVTLALYDVEGKKMTTLTYEASVPSG